MVSIGEALLREVNEQLFAEEAYRFKLAVRSALWERLGAFPVSAFTCGIAQESADNVFQEFLNAGRVCFRTIITREGNNLFIKFDETRIHNDPRSMDFPPLER